MYRVKARRWYCRPLFVLRDLGTIIDGLVLVLSLGFLGSQLQYNILKMQMNFDFYLYKKLKAKVI